MNHAPNQPPSEKIVSTDNGPIQVTIKNDGPTSQAIAAIVFVNIFVVVWVTGFVIAKGFWETLFSILPPYALYLVIEFVLKVNNLLPQ